MNKKILSGILLTTLLLNLSVFADTLPNFPMSIWWTVKNWSTSINSWTVEVYANSTKLWEITISNWQYGWNTAFDNKLTLNQFTWSLSYKLITWWLTYDLSSANITGFTYTCPANTNITFVSEVCQYDLNLDTTTPTCDPSTVTNGIVNSTTCDITCNSGYNLSWNTCVLQSSWWGWSSWGSSGGWWWWWWWSTLSVCLDSQLECKQVAWVFKLYRKTWVSCDWWNLWKTCEIKTNSENETSTWTTSEVNINKIIDEIVWGDNNSLVWWNENEFEDKIITIEKDDWTEIIIKDINKSFAKNYIEKIIKMWIANWYDDNTFRPDQPSSRVEYLKMVLKSMNIDYSDSETSKLPFIDVKRDSWEAKVISKALEFKIIDWKNKTFRPTSNVSRAEAMKMLIIAWWFTVDEKSVSSFSDVEWWAIKYIEKAKELWIINWQILNWKIIFRPYDNITRAEVAKIVVKTMEIK